MFQNAKRNGSKQFIANKHLTEIDCSSDDQKFKTTVMIS